MYKELSLKSLADFDGGRLFVAFGQALAKAMADMDDRPWLAKDRKVGLVLIMRPIADTQQQNLLDVDLEVKMIEALPPVTSREYKLSVARVGEKAKAVFVPTEAQADHTDDWVARQEQEERGAQIVPTNPAEQSAG